MTTTPTLYRPGSLAEAVALLGEDGRSLAPLAGATWVMRAALRHEPPAEGYVWVAGLPELRGTSTRPREHRFGAALTHAQLAASTAGDPDLRVLHQAAAHSANPAVRQRATLGGNLCTPGFPAADLAPALLCLDARVAVAGPTGWRELPLAEHLRTRGTGRPELLTEVLVPRGRRLTGHARLPLRQAGDYPVAIVSVAFTIHDDGTVREARVAGGAGGPPPPPRDAGRRSSRCWPGDRRTLPPPSGPPGNARAPSAGATPSRLPAGTASASCRSC